MGERECELPFGNPLRVGQIEIESVPIIGKEPEFQRKVMTHEEFRVPMEVPRNVCSQGSTWSAGGCGNAAWSGGLDE